MVQVRVYGRPDRVCYKCRATKEWLRRHGIEFQFINVDQDAAALAFIRDDLGSLEVPVVVWNGNSTEDRDRGWWAGHRIPLLEVLAKRVAEGD